MKSQKSILVIIVFAQFLCTSLWFASNGVINDLVVSFKFSASALGHLTSAVQFGFITGTLLFAILTISDRFSPSKVFFVSACMAALFNLAVTFGDYNLVSIIMLRFFTGFFLAGIYPIGMKIAADYFKEGLGVSLSFLVGALVVGTAFPHLIKSMTFSISWKLVFIITSSLSVLGGFLMLTLVPNGPYRKPSQRLNLSAFCQVFKDPSFRSAAFGYFGHMWELYAFWVFIPVMLSTYNKMHPNADLNVPIWSFIIIGLGGLACVIGGYMSRKLGVKQTAFWALLLSCCCCLLYPFVFGITSKYVFVTFLLFWGMVVIADSPLFSTLVAQNAPSKIKGTALTIVNCIGFAITIVSIQILTLLMDFTNSNGNFMLLAIGPVLGLIALRKRIIS